MSYFDRSVICIYNMIIFMYFSKCVSVSVAIGICYNFCILYDIDNFISIYS